MSKKYKIAILIDQLVFGGVQKMALENARILNELGHKTELLVLMRKGYRPQYKSFTRGVAIRFLSDSYPWPLKYSIKFPIFSFFSTLHILSPFLSRLAIKEKEFDIIISHGTTTCFTAQGIKRARHVPFLAAIHDPMDYILKKVYSQSPLRYIFPIITPVLSRLEKNIVKDSKQVLLLSNLHQKFISKTYKIKPAILPPATIVPNRITPKEKKYIMASTRWEAGKNPFLLLKVAKAIPQANIAIAGSWTNQTDYQNFKSQIKKNNLESQIHLFPKISEKRLQALYQESRLFIHPIEEAFGMGGLEAAANACPIIIPDGSGITQHLKNDEDGIFVKRITVKEFVEAAKKLWYKPELARKMGLSARSKIMSLTWESHAKSLLKIIDETFSVKKYTTIVVLETGHASESYLAGGDKLLEKMATYFPDNYKLKIILPEIGTKHWYDSKLKNVELIVLSPTVFDNRLSPTWVFLSYLVRIWQTYWQLRKLKKIGTVYSSTNVLPDVAPAFLYKLTHPQITWIARVHHLIETPLKRPGSLTVNTISYLMQSISNFMMRSKSDQTIALHLRLLDRLIKLRFNKENLSILGAGIDFEKINCVKTPKKKSFDGIFVGRIHPSKGIYDLVKIWQGVVKRFPKAKAIIIGGGSKDQEKKLRLHIKRAHLSNNLIFAGYLSDRRLYHNFRASKIFLFTDYEAGWGLAIAEAMAAGLPVVGYNLEIFGDVFKKGFLTVPLGNTTIFAQKIIQLLENKGNYQQISQEATLQAQKMSWRKTSIKFQKKMKILTINFFLLFLSNYQTLFPKN